MTKQFIPTWLKWAMIYYATGRVVTYLSGWVMLHWQFSPTVTSTAFFLGVAVVIGVIVGQTIETLGDKRDESD